MTKQDDGGGIKRYTTFVPLGATGQDIRQVACGELVMYADHAADRAAKQAEIYRLRGLLWRLSVLLGDLLEDVSFAGRADIIGLLADIRAEHAAHDDGEDDKELVRCPFGDAVKQETSISGYSLLQWDFVTIREYKWARRSVQLLNEEVEWILEQRDRCARNDGEG